MRSAQPWNEEAWRQAAESFTDGDDAALARYVHQLDVPAYACDTSGRITCYNELAVSIWGKPPASGDRFFGPARMFRPTGEEVPANKCFLALAIQNDCDMCRGELTIERDDASRVRVRAYALPLHSDCGRVTGGVNAFIQVDEPAEAPTQREQSDGLASRRAAGPASDIGSANEQDRLVVYLGADKAFYDLLSSAVAEIAARSLWISEPLYNVDELVADWRRVLIIDIDSSPARGFETLRVVKSARPNMPVVLTCHAARLRPTRFWLAQQQGAEGLLLKPVANTGAIAEIVLDEFRKHDRWHRAYRDFLAKLDEETPEQFVGSPNFDERIRKLSSREKEIMDLLVSGMQPKVIAANLGLSPKTVEHHRASVLRKLEVDTVVDLVRLVLLSDRGASEFVE